MKNEKKIISTCLFVLILFLSIISCNKSSDEVLNLNVSLKAPSGDIIASSIEELKDIISPIIDEKYNYDVKYEIITIDFIDSPKGFVAIIDYITSEGEESNLVYSKDFPNEINIEKNIKKLYCSQSKGGGYSFSCSGEECCRVHATANSDGSVDIDCGCSGCTMTIKQSSLANPGD